MKAIVKNNIFIMMLICLFLVVTINNTYSKFTYSKEIRGQVVTIASLQTLYEMLLSKSYTLDTNVNFGAISSSTNGIGLMMMSSTQNDEYPIVYYRGDVANNNVIFADLCWLIVRTTETGGIKLLFNGPVVKNTDGTQSCMNYSGVGGQSVNANSTDVFAGNIETLIATSYDSPVYTGYMYNDTNKFYNKSANVLDSNEYINHLVDNSIDNETGRHTQNKMDLKVKLLVDEWYESNILGKTEESLLEDTIWCVDRSVISSTYTIENYATNNEFYFAAFTRLYENATKRPSLVCARDVDKFTVNSSNGNGDLTYPVGMLTADEINMAGHVVDANIFTTTYMDLASGLFVTLSPCEFNSGLAGMFFVGYTAFGWGTGSFNLGARPSISLNNSATISGGDGSFESPYVIG